MVGNIAGHCFKEFICNDSQAVMTWDMLFSPTSLFLQIKRRWKKWVTVKLANPKDEPVISDGAGIQTQVIKLCFISHAVETLMLKYVQPGVLANACF